jgi:hypothetical protein
MIYVRDTGRDIPRKMFPIQDIVVAREVGSTNGSANTVSQSDQNENAEY